MKRSKQPVIPCDPFSFPVTPCHPIILSFLVIPCHSQPFLVTALHSLLPPVTPSLCHSLSLSVIPWLEQSSLMLSPHSGSLSLFSQQMIIKFQVGMRHMKVCLKYTKINKQITASKEYRFFHEAIADMKPPITI